MAVLKSLWICAERGKWFVIDRQSQPKKTKEKTRMQCEQRVVLKMRQQHDVL